MLKQIVADDGVIRGENIVRDHLREIAVRRRWGNVMGALGVSHGFTTVVILSRVKDKDP